MAVAGGAVMKAAGGVLGVGGGAGAGKGEEGGVVGGGVRTLLARAANGAKSHWVKSVGSVGLAMVLVDVLLFL